MFDADSLGSRIALFAARLTGIDRKLELQYGGCGAVLWLDGDAGLWAGQGLEGLGILAEKLRASGFGFVSMDEAAARLAGGVPQQRFLALAAGISGFLPSPALPDLLGRHGLPLALYVSPGLVSGQADPWRAVVAASVLSGRRIRMETEQGAIVLDTASRRARRRAFEALIGWLSADVPELSVRDAVRRLAMECSVDIEAIRRAQVPGWAAIRALAAHEMISIGASSMHGLRLSRLTSGVAHPEISDAIAAIALETGASPRHFVFPPGDAAAGFGGALQALGLSSALADRQGMLQPGGDLFSLPRLTVSLGDLDAGRLRTRLTGIGDALRAKFRPK